MAKKKRIRIRRGTAAQWTTANTVLRLGEIGYETDTVQLVSEICYHKFKIGNGETAWNDLPFAGWGNPVSSGGSSTVAWADITGKPSTFAPSAHTHAWSEVTGKPTEFTPAAHTHETSQVNGLDDALAQIGTDLGNKADLVDGFIPKEQIPSIAITEYLGKVDDEAEMLSLSGQLGDWCIRQDQAVPYVIVGNDPTVLAGWMQLVVPSASIVEINGKTGPTVTLTIADLAGLQAALDGKAATSHTHSIANVTGLQGELDGKASTRDVLRFVDIADGTPVTGTSGISLLKPLLIPAGTFQPGDVIRIRLRNRKTGTGGVFTSGIYIHTLPQVSGATQLGIYTTTGTTNLFSSMKRDMYIKSATQTEHFFPNTSSVTDDTAVVQAVANSNINWSIDQYLLATVNPNSSADTLTNSSLIVEIL